MLPTSHLDVVVTHGHLGIVPDTVQYIMVSSNIPWDNPRHPGDVPSLAPVTTSVQCEQITCQFDSDLVAYKVNNRPSNALSNICFYL
jgi:hypothetical protein